MTGSVLNKKKTAHLPSKSKILIDGSQVLNNFIDHSKNMNCKSEILDCKRNMANDSMEGESYNLPGQIANNKINPISLKNKPKQISKDMPHLLISTKSKQIRFFPFCVAMAHSYIPGCCITRNLRRRMQLYSYTFSSLGKSLDITYYLKIIRMVNGLKHVLLNDQQSDSLEHLRKLDVTTVRQNNDEENVTEIVKYFVDKKSRGELEQVDERLLKLLDPLIVCHVRNGSLYE